MKSLLLMLFILFAVAETGCSPETGARNSANQAETVGLVTTSSSVQINGMPAIISGDANKPANAVSTMDCAQLGAALQSNNVLINGEPALRQSAENAASCQGGGATRTSNNVAIGG